MEIFSVLKYSFKKFYEHLFKLFILGISWFILTSLLLFTVFVSISTGWYLILPIPLLLLGPLFLTALYGVNQLLEYRDFSLKVLFKYFKNNFWRGFLVCIFSIVIYLILLFDLRFFLIQGQQNIQEAFPDRNYNNSYNKDKTQACQQIGMPPQSFPR